MKIILLGYMASGKSTIGQQLANKLFLPFIDLDYYIEKKEKQTVSDIFSQKGEIYFRKIETRYLKELLAKEDSFVLSLGGGTPCYGGNMELLNQPGVHSIYLRATIETIKNRILMNKVKRPLVADISDDNLHEFIAKHLFERRSAYEKAITHVGIDNKTIKEIVDEIWLSLQ